ncbi:MAG: rhodanese-like domain-containing protein, partial [Acidobacteriota bacterium]
ANIKGTMEKGARVLWNSLQKFSSHEDWLQIWPGHGAGSACGKGISAIPYSTLGYERRFNWAFTTKTEDDFVARVLEGQPEPPTYFATMKMLNQRGPEMRRTTLPPRLDASRLAAVVAAGALVVDTRPADAFAAGHVPGTLNIPFNSSFVTWAGWLLPYDDDLYVVVAHDDDARVAELTRQLALIGLDRVAGVFSAEVAIGHAAPGDASDTIPQITAAELASRLAAGTVDVIDVRNGAEWREGHIAGARHVPLGYLADQFADLPGGKPLVLHCRSGSRSAVAASLLRRLGRREVVNLVGGLEAWRAAGLPTTGAASASH